MSTRIAHQTEESADLIIRGDQPRHARRPGDDSCQPRLGRAVAGRHRRPGHHRAGGDDLCSIPISRIVFHVARRKPRHDLLQSKHAPAAVDVSTRTERSTLRSPSSSIRPSASTCGSASCRPSPPSNATPFSTPSFAGVPYQVVARVTYADPLREHLESVSGFTVNLDWVRTQYFADILRDVGPSRQRRTHCRMSRSLTTPTVPCSARTTTPRRSPSGDFRCSSWTPPTRRPDLPPDMQSPAVEAPRQLITRSDVAVGTSACGYDVAGHRRGRRRLRNEPRAGAQDGVERREALRNAVALRVVGHARSQDAACEHPCPGGDAWNASRR